MRLPCRLPNYCPSRPLGWDATGDGDRRRDRRWRRRAVTAGLFDPFEPVGTWGMLNGVVFGAQVFLFGLARGRGWLGITARWLLALPLAVLSLGALAAVLRWAWQSRHAPPRPSHCSAAGKQQAARRRGR